MSEKIAALTVVRLCLGDLKPHPRNPRKHPASGSPQWEVLKASLGRDYFDPLVLNTRNGMLVSGHLRHKVLIELGYTHADVSVVDYDEATHLARLVAANQLLGEWEADTVSALLDDLLAAKIDPALAGLGSAEKDTLLASIQFQPVAASTQPRLDQPKLCVCPKCAHAFKP